MKRGARLLLGAVAAGALTVVALGAWVGSDLPGWLQWGQRVPIDRALGPAQVIDAQTGPLYVWRGGVATGPTVVLVHGFADSGPGWGAVAGELARHHPVVVPSLPGHGRSAPGPSESLSVAQLEQGFAAVMRQVDGPVALVGNSLGGLIVTRWAAAHPERVSRLVLVNAAVLRSPIDRADLIPKNAAALNRKNKYIVGDTFPELGWPIAGAMIALQDQPRYDALYDDVMAQPVWAEAALDGLSVPLTAVWGTPDPFLPLATVGEPLVARVPGAELVELPGCAHAPQYSCPAKLVEVLEGLLAPRQRLRGVEG